MPRQIPKSDSGDGGTQRPNFPFKTFGPLPLSRADLSKFWDGTDNNKHRKGLRCAIGIYVFATRRTERSRLVPRYVGKTDCGFEQRFKQHARTAIFQDLAQHKGELYVFLLARINKDQSFMKKRKHLPSIEILETLLIERCLHINEGLRNEKKVKYVRGLQVPGFLNGPRTKPTGPARKLRQMLGTITWKEL